ncbi:MAG TPA: hypothetical protein VEC93_08405, partial [Anaerolineae bacterium]|nr:hypothetical protein [Anaerolineae bacterium]
INLGEDFSSVSQADNNRRGFFMAVGAATNGRGFDATGYVANNISWFKIRVSKFIVNISLYFGE